MLLVLHAWPDFFQVCAQVLILWRKTKSGGLEGKHSGFVEHICPRNESGSQPHRLLLLAPEGAPLFAFPRILYPTVSGHHSAWAQSSIYSTSVEHDQGVAPLIVQGLLEEGLATERKPQKRERAVDRALRERERGSPCTQIRPEAAFAGSPTTRLAPSLLRQTMDGRLKISVERIRVSVPAPVSMRAEASGNLFIIHACCTRQDSSSTRTPSSRTSRARMMRLTRVSGADILGLSCRK